LVADGPTFVKVLVGILFGKPQKQLQNERLYFRNVKYLPLKKKEKPKCRILGEDFQKGQ
jgi:hypothetical protein